MDAWVQHLAKRLRYTNLCQVGVDRLCALTDLRSTAHSSKIPHFVDQPIATVNADSGGTDLMACFALGTTCWAQELKVETDSGEPADIGDIRLTPRDEVKAGCGPKGRVRMVT
jgi:hypothetical protein